MLVSPDLHLILASKSPRRSYLLEQAGIPFTVRAGDVEEVYPDDLDGMDIAPYLARLKARGLVHLLENENEVMLTADSVVLLDGVSYAKPADRNEAIWMLEQLSGQRHTVITGCCLKNAEREEVFSGVAEVYLNEMSREEIEWYVDTYQPYDKAGGYAIQEWVGLAKIRKIEGTYPCVMGLPVDLVYEKLVNWR